MRRLSTAQKLAALAALIFVFAAVVYVLAGTAQAWEIVLLVLSAALLGFVATRQPSPGRKRP